jgi:hypothetical protein
MRLLYYSAKKSMNQRMETTLKKAEKHGCRSKVTKFGLEHIHKLILRLGKSPR